MIVNRQPAKALTAQQVKNLREPGKYFDGHGLYLHVKPNGSRFWIQRIVIHGKRSELGLGSPDLVSLAEARAAALENRKQARSGDDPLAAKRRAREIPTFEAAARTVYELHKPTWKNKKHAEQFISSLQTYAFPRLGKRKLPEITTADVLSVLVPIWVEKNETATRVRQRIGTVLKWAVAQGWRTDNPAQDVEQALPKVSGIKAHRKALPYEDVRGCLQVIRGSNALPATKRVAEFLILNASRSGEAREAVWEEFDLEKGIWEVPAIRMKAGRLHRIPLSQRSLDILTEAFADTGGQGYVFPGAKVGRPLSDMTLSKVVKELGFPVDVHGFRTSFRTWAQEQTNFPREVAEAAMAHRTGDKAEQAYARSDLFEKRREMMACWSDFLSGS